MDEFYFFDGIGILLSKKAYTKDDLLSLMNESFDGDVNQLIKVLANHKIRRVFTLAAPKFKYNFQIKDTKVVEKTEIESI